MVVPLVQTDVCIRGVDYGTIGVTGGVDSRASFATGEQQGVHSRMQSLL